MRIRPKFALTLLCSLLILPQLASAVSETNRPDTESRVKLLLGKLSQEEKIQLISGDEDGFSTKAIPRLGIPKLIMADGPAGVRNYGTACHFPAGAALAATWDTALAERFGKALALEARARGVHIQLGPGVNLCRVPVNGRNFEYFGEDPYLTSRITVAWIEGLQREGVAATVKHFACNNQEWNRNSVNVDVDERALHEIYLPPFRAAVQEAHVAAVMAAYNRVQGEYCTANEYLLKTVLRDSWGFNGLLMSDWWATHKVQSLASGLDLEMPKAAEFKPEGVSMALASGILQGADLDRAVGNFLRTAIGMGFLDRPQKLENLPLDSKDSDQVALEVARAGIVLLKNQSQALPLDRAKVKRIAVYGPNADDTPAGGGGSGDVHAIRRVSFLDGIRKAAGVNVEVVSMAPKPVGPKVFEQMDLARTSAEGEAGLKLAIKINGKEQDGGVQRTINLAWKAHETPLAAIPAGAYADLIFTGVLVAPETGEWELVSDQAGWRAMEVTINGRKQPIGITSQSLKLEKGMPVSIRIDVPANTAENGHARFAIRKYALPDLEPARKADAVIFCGGLSASAEREEYDREFEAPADQKRLLCELARANPRTIVVLNSGAALGMADCIESTPAVVQAWYLGQEGGTALGEILFGDVNPSGKLCSTFDRTFAENPAFANYPGEQTGPFPVVHYREGIFFGYRGHDKAGTTPLFPFGHGLSYTSFRMPSMKVALNGDHATVRVQVKNTGSRTGAEVVQVYVGQKHCALERPKRELKGFAKVELKPGESKEAKIELNRSAFAYWSPAQKDWVVDPGAFVIDAGASERDIRQTQTVTIKP